MVAIMPIVVPLLVGERRVVFKNITWQGYQQLPGYFGRTACGEIDIRSRNSGNYDAIRRT